ncbi:MAG: dihydrolipoyl dehydrogenase [Alphaproteobacteria bacterium]|nr:dihydrolipoyl dehydrogenase [Alphaproteobacteria bacterium]
MSQSFDIVVIGGGPGGYVAAIRGAQLGFTVACVEKRPTLGGTCLNVGCIPSKALLHLSERFAALGKENEKMGIFVDNPRLDMTKVLKHKNDIVAQLTKGIDFLFKKNKVTSFAGMGRIPAAGVVEVQADDGTVQQLHAKHIVIATGSEVATLPNIAVDEVDVVSSTGALDFDAVPKHLVVIGGGVIGLELGMVWRRLGAEVTVVEFADQILPGQEDIITKKMASFLKKQKYKVMTKSAVTGVTKAADGSLSVAVASRDDPAKTSALQADKVLVATGRRPVTAGLGLEALGIATDKRGFIAVGGEGRMPFETAVPGIYAIGDCVPGAMLAHKAEDEGVACMELLAGQHPHIDYNCIPAVVYTNPEIASVGMTTQALKAAGREVVTGDFAMSGNSRARAVSETEGLVRVIADRHTDQLLGVHIMGAHAGEMIHEAVAVMEFGGSAEDIARLCHAHPTFSEAVKEAALALDGRAIHA